ncbi:MAG: NAD-dependent epimerase/dehydratase family protein [Archangium sp.]
MLRVATRMVPPCQAAMRVLVTGGAGFIGGNLTRALAARGDEVLVFDNLVASRSTSAIDGVPGATFVHGDVRCPEDFAQLGTAPFDRVYHLAGSFANELSVEFPAIDLRSNVDGTRNTLAFARQVGCGLFIYTGSSSSYGAVSLPMSEGATCAPQTPYAQTKLEGERSVRASGLPSALFRLFNVYGPGDPPGRYRNAIPNMMRMLEDEGSVLRVFGREATRDFTYVDDVVRVLLDAHLAVGELVNVGSGNETQILELARLVLSIFGLPAERVRLELPRSWDRIPRRCASTERLERLLGFKPTTALRQGLERTAEWLYANRFITRRVLR